MVQNIINNIIINFPIIMGNNISKSNHLNHLLGKLFVNNFLFLQDKKIFTQGSRLTELLKRYHRSCRVNRSLDSQIEKVLHRPTQINICLIAYSF